MDNTPNSQERLDQLADEAREKMLEGEETPWLDRDTHRGESPHTEGGGYVDPVAQGPGMSGSVAGGSGGQSDHRVYVSATSSGASSGTGHGVHGRNTEGAFGDEDPSENYVPGEGTDKNAISKLRDDLP